MLKEEGDVLASALVADFANPIAVHRARVWAAFAANDHPVDVLQVQGADWGDEGFDGEEADGGGGGAEVVDAGEGAGILDGDAEPNVVGGGAVWRLRRCR